MGKITYDKTMSGRHQPMRHENTKMGGVIQ